jgi:hypothetical protein
MRRVFYFTRTWFAEREKLTTNPHAKAALESIGGDVQDLPLVIEGNIATAGGCLSLMYLVGWLAERLFDSNKRKSIQNQLIPAGQLELFEEIISKTIESAELANLHNNRLKRDSQRMALSVPLSPGG